uniref:Transposase MuDR plant domain-containing protein n=1 Tax=Lactuca sativa TaxID=4236 RepID=A0A9R1X2C6_LACSA|nr:hypothetical protein LSAT_V11C700364050 [Lactuca sativa]
MRKNISHISVPSKKQKKCKRKLGLTSSFCCRPPSPAAYTSFIRRRLVAPPPSSPVTARYEKLSILILILKFSICFWIPIVSTNNLFLGFRKLSALSVAPLMESQTPQAIRMTKKENENSKNMNFIIDMIDDENFSIISQAAVVTNLMNIDNDVELNEILEDGIGDEDDDEASFENNNDFTRELGNDSFKDKKELVKAIKIHSIRTHRQFEVIESRPTIWTLRCKLYLQSGCKWKLHASKHKHSGYFENATYTGPHTCLHYKLSQGHLNLDVSLIAMETRHLIKEQPSISIPALRAEIVENLGNTLSYKKVWVGNQKAIEHEEYYVALPKYLGALQKFNP